MDEKNFKNITKITASKGYTRCSNCQKEGLTIPLTEEDNSLVCGLCGASFPKNI